MVHVSKKDEQIFMKLLDKASNNMLYWMRDQIDHEISLSETAIKEGFEKRK